MGNTKVQTSKSKRWSWRIGIILLLLFLPMQGWAQVNNPPVAVASPGGTVLAGHSATIDGLGSYDPDGDPITYQWVQIAGTAVVLSQIVPGVEYFFAPIVPVGGETLTFELTVSDGALSSSTSINFTVRNGNNIPVAAAGADQVVAEGAAVTLDGSGSFDADGDPIKYLWIQIAGPSITLNNANQALASFVLPTGTAGSILEFRLLVSDGLQGSSDNTQVTVISSNQAPTADAGSDQTIEEGLVATLDGSASSDPDGDAMTYSWTQTGGPTVTLDLSNPVMPTFTAPEIATDLAYEDLTFELVVNDGELSSNGSTVTVRVADKHFAPPNCAFAHPSKTSLGKANHKMRKIVLKGIAKQAQETTVVTITSITSDEPTSGTGPGDSSPDASVRYKTEVEDWGVKTKTEIYLRQERDPNADGRVYIINFDAQNTISGAMCSGSVQVVVPLKKHGTAIDSGQLYDATLN
jgi:hypothetical protein